MSNSQESKETPKKNSIHFHYKIHEIVLTFVLSGILGVIFFVWTYAYEALSPILKPLGLSGLNVGIWMIGGIIPALIIKKPGIAFIGEVFASFIEIWITKWGLTAIVWGVVQGIGAELIFLLFLYKKWDSVTALLSGLSASLFSFALDFYFSQYFKLKFTFNLIQASAYAISGIIEGGLLSYLLVKGLFKTGALNRFKTEKISEIDNHFN